ncbi:hypothetical protein YC2023_108891 [Brassica napus]
MMSSYVSAALDKDCIDFLPWLEQIAGAKLTNTLSIGKSVYGRALFASKVIHAGDCILKVPFNAQITPDELPADIRVSLTDKVGNIGKLAALLMIEINAGQNSRWFPYISRLPQLSDMHSAIFWDENEFSMIRCSAVHKESVKQKARIEKEFSLVSQAHPYVMVLANIIDICHGSSCLLAMNPPSTHSRNIFPKPLNAQLWKISCMQGRLRHRGKGGGPIIFLSRPCMYAYTLGEKITLHLILFGAISVSDFTQPLYVLPLSH